jgi:hypothetical protein
MEKKKKKKTIIRKPEKCFEHLVLLNYLYVVA